VHYLPNTIDDVIFYNYRLIPEKERSFALGVQWTVSKCLGKYLHVFLLLHIPAYPVIQCPKSLIHIVTLKACIRYNKNQYA